jgi:hypothetical protein
MILCVTKKTPNYKEFQVFGVFTAADDDLRNFAAAFISNQK